MGKSTVDKEKEFYKLWIEYLKRSDDYKKFCEILKHNKNLKKKKNPPLPIPGKFKHSRGYIGNFYIFGLIHDKQWTFEKWWKRYKGKAFFHNGFPVDDYISRWVLGVKEEFKPEGIVEDYVNSLQSDMDICIRKFKSYNQGREPTLSEFKEYFLNELKDGNLSQYITIRIDPRGETTDDILKQIKKFIREKRKNLQIRNREFKFIKYFKPSTKLRLDELKKYLNVYNLKQQIPKLKPKEIIKKINPNDDANDLEVQRVYRDFYQKAKKIIQWVEHGFFPGPYDKTTFYRKKRNAKTL